MTEPKLSRGKAKAALQALSRGKRDSSEADIGELYPFGLYTNKPRDPSSDRETVISCVNALEQTLEEAILTKFNLRADADETLFLNSAAPLLNDFYAKCSMAYLLGIVGKQTLHDLSVIRYVRNAFAHTRGNLTFDMEQLQNMLEHLTAPDRWLEMMSGEHNQDLRERFIKTCFQIAMYLSIGIEGEKEPGRIMRDRQATFQQ